MNRTIASAALAGALLLGGTGAAILPSLVAAADPTAAPSAATAAPATNGTDPAGRHGGPGEGGPGRLGMDGPGGPGKGGPGRMHVEAVSHASVVATALGISEADLTTALQSGKSLADVAAANNVDVQKVIDALVADARTEIAADVTAGTLTQAQADTQLANVVQRITDRVNHAGKGGPGRPDMGGPGRPDMGGPGRPGDHGAPHGDPNQAPATATPAG